METIIIPKYCCAEYNKDTHSFQPTDAWETYEEMMDELGAYTDSDRTPDQHNALERQRPLNERVIFCAIEDLPNEGRLQVLYRGGHFSQQMNVGDGGCDTFVPNWFEREHFEGFIGRKFENNEEYTEFLFHYLRFFGNHLASCISTLVEETVSDYYEEQWLPE